MSSGIESLKKLFAENPEAAEKAKAISRGKQEDIQDALIALAGEYGITLEEKDFQGDDAELDEESLDAVAGGSAADVIGTIIGILNDELPDDGQTNRKGGGKTGRTFN